MALICLVLSGAALLVNGLTLLGHVPGRDSGVFNVLIGGLQLVLCIAVAVSADGSLPALFAIAGTFLFGLTYLYVGLDALFALGSVGLGWFCGLVAALAVVFAVVHVSDDPVLAVLWAGWAVLWTLFFVLLALGRSAITTYTGWALVLASQVTTTVPAVLGLTGHWPTGPIATSTALVVLVAVFGGAALLSRRTAVRTALTTTTPGDGDTVTASPATAPAAA
ncbi:AmiS/UreI family transporter [Curtobacterium sp. VKM Ac-2922]|uniref:AmiS/UreI family transporter n=1 Tax=Curtobacterium sp. VKM Ac-2922 TaxID=2929475 RepID=UPI001FB53118|nr:AmiS/UreI family transporter [Curtobacterium sp. VKM Ac-2922]MCJ1714952.1 AmiS/UreI transporter [Curtobacterium sp. VKM Ac-2922]